MAGYKVACFILSLIIASYIPAMIAAYRNRRFSKWYVYALVLFPVALFHSILLKKPQHTINVYRYDKTSPLQRNKNTYLKVPVEKKRQLFSPGYVCMVFVSKLIFGAFMALALFALFRTFVKDTASLRFICCVFALLFSMLLSVVQMCGFSRFPIIADEITKRAIMICAISIACSLPLFLIKNLVLDILMTKHSEFLMFVCTLASFGLFLFLMLRMQSYYYSIFYKFSDYCVLSVCAYAIFTAITLIWMSISDIRAFIYAIAMPMQIFNLNYLSGVDYIENISYIYSSAFVNLFIEIIILFSGLLCRNYKKKELAYRVEYRTKAFRMSQKRVLRRHIPKSGMVKTKSLQNV